MPEVSSLPLALVVSAGEQLAYYGNRQKNLVVSAVPGRVFVGPQELPCQWLEDQKRLEE